MIRSPCLFFSSQRTLVHLLRFFTPSFNYLEDTQVVDGVECGCVIRSPCLLLTSQRTLVHHLRIFKTSLSFVEATQVVDGVECGCVIGRKSVVLGKSGDLGGRRIINKTTMNCGQD